LQPNNFPAVCEKNTFHAIYKNGNKSESRQITFYPTLNENKYTSSNYSSANEALNTGGARFLHEGPPLAVTMKILYPLSS
jgi:hypothetical protein